MMDRRTLVALQYDGCCKHVSLTQHLMQHAAAGRRVTELGRQVSYEVCHTDEVIGKTVLP